MNEPNVASNITTVSIPKPVAERLKKQIEGTGFTSLSSYVTYILRQVISNVESQQNPQKKGEGFSEEDERKVKERLRSMGYLD